MTKQFHLIGGADAQVAGCFREQGAVLGGKL